jgi:hypothetical protein
LERARRIFFDTVQDGAQSLPDVLQAVDGLVAAERADAARQERRRTLEEVARLIDPEKPDHETTWLLDRLEEMSLNERIREAT